jgi:thiol-disulfide isomerase/thioredoxin
MRFNLTLVALLALLQFACTTNKPKLYVVDIHGDWCNTCKRTDKALTIVKERLAKDPKVKFLVLNQTEPDALDLSKETAELNGLSEIYEYERHTGEVLFVEPASARHPKPKILAKYYDVQDADKYLNAIDELLAGHDVQSILAEKRDYELSKPNASDLEEAELYVVDIHHDMCGGCALTAPNFEEVAKNYEGKPKVAFMTFDLTTKTTTDESRMLANDLGIKDIYDTHKHTGEVLFIDAKTKQIIDTLVLEQDQAKYHELVAKYVPDVNVVPVIEDEPLAQAETQTKSAPKAAISNPIKKIYHKIRRPKPQPVVAAPKEEEFSLVEAPASIQVVDPEKSKPKRSFVGKMKKLF